MPYRNIIFEKEQPFHILSRAVEERKIFYEEADCYRFIFQMYAANIGKPAFNLKRADIIKTAKELLQGEETPPNLIIKEHAPLVSFLDFALVVNHYHFYLVSNIENGIPLYMKKLNGGFAKYFNLKHNRKGALFGSRYQSILVKTDFQLDAISRYINIINPLDVYSPGWRERGIDSWEEAMDFLKNYQFSNFPDRIGKRKSKILAVDDILDKFFNKDYNKEEYIKFAEDFLKQKLISFSPVFLE